MNFELGIVPYEKPKKPAKSVFSPGLARFLIKSQKHKLVDIKKDKYYGNDKTIFLFENTPELWEDIKKYKDTLKTNKK